MYRAARLTPKCRHDPLHGADVARRGEMIPMQRMHARRVRNLLTPDGAEWTVFEFAVWGLRGLTVSLVFDGEVMVQRIRDYPVNWYELSDLELAALGECV